MNVEISFGERLRDIRFDADLTQEELAKKLGVKRTKIADWETGRAEPKSLKDIIDLANILNTSCDMLLRGISPNFLDIHKDTGLSDNAIKTLIKIKKHKAFLLYQLSIAIVNYLLSNENRICNLSNIICGFSKTLKTYIGVIGALQEQKDKKGSIENSEIYKLVKDEIIDPDAVIGEGIHYRRAISKVISHEDNYMFETYEARANEELDISEYRISKHMINFVHDISKEIIKNPETQKHIKINKSMLERIGI